MTVKIVTDSLSDITSNLAQELGITVVPLTVTFGRESFLDRVTMTTDEFYQKLVTENVLPTTTQPPPADFIEVFNRLAGSGDILTIVLSKKLSGTYESALAAKGMVKKNIRIEVIDSQQVAMGLGLIVIAAAKAAKKGATLDELVALVKKAITKVHIIMYFDTLKYLAKGGRIGKAQGLLGSLLQLKPILTIKDGEVSPVTRVRSRSAGIDYLCNYAKRFSEFQEMAVEHATTPEDAEKLVEQLSAIYPRERIYRSTVSPVLGTYAGPSVLSVSVLEALD